MKKAKEDFRGHGGQKRQESKSTSQKLRIAGIALTAD
jgi:hypothetical protein